mgnify:CR=1 FL=1
MPRVALIWSRRSTHYARSGHCSQARYNFVSVCFITESGRLSATGSKADRQTKHSAQSDARTSTEERKVRPWLVKVLISKL